jgi:hypothetical protein
MASKWVASLKMRMIEVALRVTMHTNSLHNPNGIQIAWHREGYDLRQSERSETMSESGHGCLGRVAVAPIGASQAPADFDGWCEWGGKGYGLQSHKADKRCHAQDFHSPKPEAVLNAMLLKPPGLSVALLSAHGSTEPSPYLRIRV